LRRERHLAARAALHRPDAVDVHQEAPVDAQELAAGELVLQLVDAADRRL
jgi:hypothetical protein